MNLLIQKLVTKSDVDCSVKNLELVQDDQQITTHLLVIGLNKDLIWVIGNKVNIHTDTYSTGSDKKHKANVSIIFQINNLLIFC